MSATVTIERSYLDLLLRRASPNDKLVQKDPNTITIFKALHEELVRQCREYHALRQALMAGGVSEETLSVLVSPASDNTLQPPPGLYSNTAQTTTSTPAHASTGFWPSPSKDTVASKPSETGNFTTQISRPGPVMVALKPQVAMPAVEHIMDMEDDMSSIGDIEEDQYEGVPSHSQRRETRRDHTLLFSNLPIGTSHRDVTSVAKGGRLIHIWLRRDERSANVTFADGASAFLAYAKRNDIYVNGKRIDVSWSDWQFKPHRNLLNKLGQGVSRNMVIRHALHRLSEEEIREHMEHIHNLVITQFIWKDSSAYISTNSIIGAYSARQCLHTRKQYKGVKIDWYPDECNVPLPIVGLKPRSQTSHPAVHATSPRKTVDTTSNVNRFNLLSLESSSDLDSSADSHDSSSSGIMLRPRSNASINNED